MTESANERQQEFFSNSTFSMLGVVMYTKDADNQLVRHTHDLLSLDTTQDPVWTLQAMPVLLDATRGLFDRVFLWSDNGGVKAHRLCYSMTKSVCSNPLSRL
jgi:hypothetical protein